MNAPGTPCPVQSADIITEDWTVRSPSKKSPLTIARGYTEQSVPAYPLKSQ